MQMKDDPQNETPSTLDTAGALYVVSTPIGNLSDLSPRAIKTLQSVDLILAEDTRTFGILKKRFDINTRTISYHDHNEQSRTPQIITDLKNKKNVALVSEAGTPCIADPGYRIVRACRENNIIVIPVPGASAILSALAISGFEINRFMFEGFLPQKSGKRKRVLTEAINSNITTVFYESPFRILTTLNEIANISPQKHIFVAKELTKIYEQCFLGSALEVYEELSKQEKVKGEFVLIIRGN